VPVPSLSGRSQNLHSPWSGGRLGLYGLSRHLSGGHLNNTHPAAHGCVLQSSRAGVTPALLLCSDTCPATLQHTSLQSGAVCEGCQCPLSISFPLSRARTQKCNSRSPSSPRWHHRVFSPRRRLSPAQGRVSGYAGCREGGAQMQAAGALRAA
jgi:hypothetical protein